MDTSYNQILAQKQDLQIMLKSAEIKNWKLKEVANYVEIVASDSIQYRDELLNELQLPQTGAGMYKSLMLRKN